MSIRENGNNVINEMYEQPAVRPSGWGGDRAEPTETTASPRRSARVSDVEKREERRREGGREGGVLSSMVIDVWRQHLKWSEGGKERGELFA